MSDLKDQQMKLLRAEVAGKTMEYLMGLNVENNQRIRRVIKKSVKKIVRAYYETIKQHKEVLKQRAKKERKNKVLTGDEPVKFTEKPHLKVC